MLQARRDCAALLLRDARSASEAQRVSENIVERAEESFGESA